MSATQTPRVVVVTRPSDYTSLLARHATRGQARFFLERRGGSIDEVEARHHLLETARAQVAAAIPVDWRRTATARGDLDRFLFEPSDLVVVIGQDGLVPNVAKYLTGQPVIGVDPEPGRNAGVLVRHTPPAVADLLADCAAGRATLEDRTMVEAQLEGGERLIALNEIFVGHRSHQSARYAIEVDGLREQQSSSGMIVATGTGATGWASSIRRERKQSMEMPKPSASTLAWFVREAWPSNATGTTLTAGLLMDQEVLSITSEMDHGVVFGDGIEQDHLTLPWGQPVYLRRAPETLKLVT